MKWQLGKATTAVRSSIDSTTARVQPPSSGRLTATTVAPERCAR
jgi:hypothetical protein